MTMAKSIAVLCLLCSLTVACAGPVQFAKDEKEGIKTGYLDPELTALSRKYGGLLRSVYAKYRLKNVRLAKDGLGFTSLTDDSGQKLYFLMVEIRPAEINFDKNKTTGEERLQTVLQHYFEPNLKVLNEDDVVHDDINGIAFGVTWAVRDFSQCDTAGGFVEYVLAYIDNNGFLAILDGSETLSSVLSDSEVVTSLDLAKPKSIKLRYE
jgi:hypothetical protein